MVIATGAATLLGRILIGPNPAFTVPEIFLPPASSFGVEEAVAFVALGALCGVAAWALIRVLVFMEDGFPKLPGGIYVQNIIGMTMIGLMMLGLTHTFGHSYVDGRRLWRDRVDPGPGHDGDRAPRPAVRAQAVGDDDQPRLRRFGRHLFAFAISWRDARSGLRVYRRPRSPQRRPDLPSAAIVGMAAMVGAGTGGVMTAIIMVFEMTRDYAIIVPVIVAVAVAAGVRRALIPETIYTIKLRHRGHRIPKERHVNLYLVQQAKDVMERRFILAKAGSSLRECMGREDVDDLRAIIVEDEGRIVGLIPPRSGLWRGKREQPEPAGR